MSLDLDERPLPANDHAEKLVLGAGLSDPEAWPVIAELLTADDFATETHKRIFLRMSEVFERGLHLEPNVVTQELEKHRQRESVGGLSYLLDLSSVPILVNLDKWCEMVKQVSVRRQVIIASRALVESCFTDSGEVDTDLERIREVITNGSKKTIAKSWDDVVEESGGFNAFLSAKTETGIRIPFREIHETLDGLRKQCLTILGARPAVGKTQFAMQLAHYAAQSGHTVLFVSLEMGAKRLIHRALTGRAMVSSYKFRRGLLDEEELQEVQKAAFHFASFEKRMLYADQAGMSVQGLEALLRSLASRGQKVDLLVIDYLQLLRSTGKHENRVQEVSYISRMLKGFTMRYDMPVLALSQLTARENDITAEPQLNWLKESGQLEQDADQVMFLWPKRDDPDNNIRDIKWKIAKNRDGSLNWGELPFQAKYCQFLADSDLEQGVA